MKAFDILRNLSFFILFSKHETSESESLDVVCGQITWIVERRDRCDGKAHFLQTIEEKFSAIAGDIYLTFLLV